MNTKQSWILSGAALIIAIVVTWGLLSFVSSVPDENTLGGLPGQALTQSATSTASITSSSTEIVAARSQRASITICLAAGNQTYVVPTFSGASAKAGDVLSAVGGCATYSADERWVGPFYGVTDTGTSTLSVTEIW